MMTLNKVCMFAVAIGTATIHCGAKKPRQALNGYDDVFIIGVGMSGVAAAREISLYNKVAALLLSYLWATDGGKNGGRMKKSAQKVSNIFLEDGAV